MVGEGPREDDGPVGHGVRGGGEGAVEAEDVHLWTGGSVGVVCWWGRSCIYSIYIFVCRPACLPVCPSVCLL